MVVEIEKLLGADPPLPQVSLALDEGVVQDCGRPHAAASSVHP